MLTLKSKEEIELIRESALIVSKTLGMLASEVKPGVTTLYLDKLAEDFIRAEGAIPGFLGLYDFPNTLCMSPNAPALDFASGIKALSCLAIANPKVTGMSAFTVFAIKLSRYASGKRTSRSSQASASIID